VIGDRHGRHFPARSFIDNFLEIARTIQQAVIRVQMQVNESGGFHAERYSNLAREFWLRPDSPHPAYFRGRSLGDISFEEKRGHYHRGSTRPDSVERPRLRGSVGFELDSPNECPTA
jgi:hypothetical protein